MFVDMFVTLARTSRKERRKRLRLGFSSISDAAERTGDKRANRMGDTVPPTVDGRAKAKTNKTDEIK
ncbi:uncharacterized protein LOC100866030 [Anopheles sinensis]|uniref:Uncharacterized protein LOC100866030 n=1 Tax=Anopheles sinensis TaxID=74873 RepID=A0A084WKM7_ANOSI|nr:uncharacterized protein LOC100866030 [Anopheles sinensis]